MDRFNSSTISRDVGSSCGGWYWFGADDEDGSIAGEFATCKGGAGELT